LNTSGSFNPAAGFQALGQTVDALDGTVATGNHNTAVGERALGGVTTGSYEATLGAEAGSEVNTANNVICIGAGVPSISSVVGEMLVGQDGKLGTQGFNGSQSAVSILQNAHPQSMLNEFRNEQRQGRAIARAN
jgi:hypothetical protein